MKFLQTIIGLVEYLFGQSDHSPPGWQHRWDWLWTGFLWAVLGSLIWAFSGQESRFIYIDF
jgi:hypothetical protein